MTRRKQQYDSSREAEMLDSKIRMDGVGEDPLVRDLLSDEFVTMPDTQAAGIAKALAELLTGMKINSAQNEAIMKRFDKIEKAQRAWETDKQKFLDEVDARSRSLLTTNPAQRDKYAAEFMQAAKEAKEMAIAQATMDKVQFHAQLENEPKETITSMGTMEIFREGDQLIPRVVPDVIAIKDRKWVLPPGIPVEVPHTVAVRWREIQRGRASIVERQNLMKDAKNESSVVAREWQRINEKYQTGGETMPSPV